MNNAVKVLSLVSYKFLPPEMGGQKNIAYFNRYLSRHLNLTCITVKKNINSTEPYPVKNIISNSKSRYINPFLFFKLKKFIKTENITHLVIEHPYYGWLGLLLKWFCVIKLIIHAHNIESMRFKSVGKWWWGILWHYEKFVLRKADHSFFIQTNDITYAMANYKLRADQCTLITYGVENSEVTGANIKSTAKQIICNTYNIPETARILLFNGTLNYKPNLEAINIILEKINPALMAIPGFIYKIIICGNKLPASCKGLIDYKDSNIIYAGFVDDINMYFNAADIFINPVIEGGGIKTKVVDALAHGCSVVSTASGAIGIPAEVTGNKMKIAADNNWEVFVNHVISIKTDEHTPAAFFEYFSWENISRKAAAVING